MESLGDILQNKGHPSCDADQACHVQVPTVSSPGRSAPELALAAYQTWQQADCDDGDGEVEGGGEACIDCEHCGKKLLGTC